MIDETATVPDGAEIDGVVFFQPRGIRTEIVSSYDIPRLFYTEFFLGRSKGRRTMSPVRRMREIGCLMFYALSREHSGGGKKRIPVIDIDALVEKWRATMVQLCTAHSKDEADRAEASIDELLTPILAAPIKQIRQFAPKLLDALRNDPNVPFLVWRGYEVWVEGVLSKADDEEVKVLKTDLARQIVDLVESDAKNQLPEAMIRALMWRSPQQLEKVKTVVQQEKEAGRPVRLRGRESCLFLEAGGTEQEPAVCIQI